MAAAAVVTLAVVALWALVVGLYARRLLADWREPVLSAPVLIIESDDWGPGPASDAERLQQILALLQTFRDAEDRRPVFTLGVVLAVPGPPAGAQGDAGPDYSPRFLDEAEFSPLRGVMLAGRDAGAFALQLHGMEHFWPPALVRAAHREAAVRSFLGAGASALRHESLPSHLQSRWIDASRLPSVALDRGAIEGAVADETRCFARVFGEQARVAVPVTFTWTVDVEAAWARRGVRVVVTPGTRNTGRDASGGLIGDGSMIRNGDVGAGDIVYVVRDVYFEPARGHRAIDVLDEIDRRFRLGRPALLEMHRLNFIGDDAEATASLAELGRLLTLVLQRYPQLRFVSTEELARALKDRASSLVDRRPAARVRAFLLRVAAVSRLRKLAWLTGLALPAALALAAATVFLPPPAKEEKFK
jgi:hypothetical protein